MAISNKNDRLTIILPKTLKEKVRQLAESENRSMGNYIVTILESHVDKNYKPVMKGQLDLFENENNPKQK